MVVAQPPIRSDVDRISIYGRPAGQWRFSKAFLAIILNIFKGKNRDYPAKRWNNSSRPQCVCVCVFME
jgi:hypothetical protein